MQYEMPKITPDFNTLSPLVQGYIKAMFFTDAGPDSDELSEAGYSDLSAESLTEITNDCDKFKEAAAKFLDVDGYSEEQAGHDFWLTRNHHGTGFWDRNELDADGKGKALTDIAHGFGESDLYLGDDGKVYVS